MRIFLFLVFAIASFSFGQSPTQPNLLSKNEVSTIGYWSVGDKKSYHLTQVRSDYKNGKKDPYSKREVQHDILVSVLDSTDSSYSMRMLFKNASVIDGKNSKKEGLRPLTDYHVDYVTDEYGVFDSISNISELRLLLKKYVFQTLDRLEMEEDSSAIASSEFLDNMFEDDLVSLLFQREIMLLHTYYGMQLKLDVPIDLEMEYPPIGEVVMLGEGKITLKSIDEQRDFCRFIMTQKPYNDEIERFLEELLKQLLGDEAYKMDISEVSLSSTSKLSGTMELSTGWMKKASSTTTMKTKSKGKEKKTLFLLSIEEK